MTDLQVGRILRALRRRLRLTQRQLGLRVGVSQQTISLIERGHGSRPSTATLRRVFAAVDARWEPAVSWRGGALDRLLDDAHAKLVEEVVDRLQIAGWEVVVEATYSEYGERGSIDVFGGRRDVLAALMVEVKSDLTVIDATLRKVTRRSEWSATRCVGEGSEPRGNLSGLLIVANTNRRSGTGGRGGPQRVRSPRARSA